MTQLLANTHQSSTQPIANLTLAELEHMIEKIVQRTLRENIQNFQISEPSQSFFETFGTWKDDRTSDEIIDEIYNSRPLEQSED